MTANPTRPTGRLRITNAISAISAISAAAAHSAPEAYPTTS
ncbi:hypothetical protein QBA35_14065 [Streptomyces bottropensis]|uniref:Uncharacterized protein n=1 Tax=Streptomyces bottropensis TaxID=42235 RepID=A0ABU8AMP5_9ACTN